MTQAAGMATDDFYFTGEGFAPRKQWDFGHGSARNLADGGDTT